MFCHKCGSVLLDDALFCSNCGNKIPKDTQKNEQFNSSNLPMNLISTKSNANSSEVSKNIVADLINKHFYSLALKEENLLIFNEDDRKISSFSRIIQENYTSQRPLLVFNYMNEGMKSGFVITETTFSYIFGTRCNKYSLKDIKTVIKDKSVLATVIFFKFFDGGVSSDLYLTSIRNINLFIEAMQNFFLELNQPEEYGKLQSMIQSKDVETLLKVTLTPYIGDYTYLFINVPFSSNMLIRSFRKALPAVVLVTLFYLYFTHGFLEGPLIVPPKLMGFMDRTELSIAVLIIPLSAFILPNKYEIELSLTCGM